MERFQEAQEKAIKKLRLADHMLFVTYPLVKDPKLLLAVLDNLFTSIDSAMASLIYFEQLFKRIPPFPDTFEARLDMFKTKLVPRFNIGKEYVMLINNLREVLKEHKSSTVEFSRNDKFVICSNNYRLRTLTVDDLKRYVSTAKKFVNEMDGLVKRDDIFAGRRA